MIQRSNVVLTVCAIIYSLLRDIKDVCDYCSIISCFKSFIPIAFTTKTLRSWQLRTKTISFIMDLILCTIKDNTSYLPKYLHNLLHIQQIHVLFVYLLILPHGGCKADKVACSTPGKLQSHESSGFFFFVLAC